jgi:hypothetical protein
MLDQLMGMQPPVTQQDITPGLQAPPGMPASPWPSMSPQMKDLVWKTLNKERDRQWKDRMQAPAVEEVDSLIKRMGGW